ncbi:MAG: hypothetical protein EAZ60_16045, partial [Oscillatoriales cyanobacterium]
HGIPCNLSQLKKTQINDISHSSSPQPNAGVFYWRQPFQSLDRTAFGSQIAIAELKAEPQRRCGYEFP